MNTFDRVHVKEELTKCEMRVESLMMKMDRQQEKVNSAEKNVKLFTLEKVKSKENLRVCLQ